jgi:8-oxo-dGTP diphosphatase
MAQSKGENADEPQSEMVRRISDVDWRTWEAHDPATLVFVVSEGQVLLIRKKRGLGAGKINGPGGRLEVGESPLDCAIREVQEELRTTPTGLEICGENRFQFVDGYSTHVYVFRAAGCDGEPQETEEATPFWAPIERIPYEQMWEDDELWLPLVFRGMQFSGRFIFDGDTMLDYQVEEES